MIGLIEGKTRAFMVGQTISHYLIVEKRGASVLYASPDADLTDEIIRAYDQQAPGKKSP